MVRCDIRRTFSNAWRRTADLLKFMGLFSALSGKIYRFNSINIPIDNGIAARIKELDESSTERILLTMAFGITQEMVGLIFHPDDGIFRKSLDSLTKESLEKTYYVLMDLSISQIIQTPMLNIDEKGLINDFAQISKSTADKKKEDVEIYKKAESGVMKAYENICQNLSREGDAQTAIPFGTSFIKIHNDVMTKLGKAIYN